MSLDPTTFEAIVPSRYITFTLPNPRPHPALLRTPDLRVAVLDSPTSSADPTIAAMLVPPDRESDWNFSTEAGLFQILLTLPHLSRLVLIGNSPNVEYPTSYRPPLLTVTEEDVSLVQDILAPLLLALTPKAAFSQTGGGLPEIPFLMYEDEVVRSVVLEVCAGPRVGEMLIEDVELRGHDGEREFRRRLRFKRMPNLIQTQVKIHPNILEFEELEGVEFSVDDGILVHPYLEPMVAGLSVIGCYLDERIRQGFKPKTLCLGVGGGALLRFLGTHLHFEVWGVEEDEAVLRVASKYFGLQDGDSLHLHVGDGIEVIQRLASQAKSHNIELFRSCAAQNCGTKIDQRFDVIMVDLDSSNARMGTRAPPLEFISKSILLDAISILSELGVFIINVIPKCFCDLWIQELQVVFEELYEIDVGNGENFVLIATVSPCGSISRNINNNIVKKLQQVISGLYMDALRKIPKLAAS